MNLVEILIFTPQICLCTHLYQLQPCHIWHIQKRNKKSGEVNENCNLCTSSFMSNGNLRKSWLIDSLSTYVLCCADRHLKFLQNLCESFERLEASVDKYYCFLDQVKVIILLQDILYQFWSSEFPDLSALHCNRSL